jgi:hypothetical protein
VEGEATHVCGYCHEKESAGVINCEGERAKSMRCVEEIQARAIWSSLEKAPLLDILMRISPCDPGGKTAGEEILLKKPVDTIVRGVWEKKDRKTKHVR